MVQRKTIGKIQLILGILIFLSVVITSVCCVFFLKTKTDYFLNNISSNLKIGNGSDMQGITISKEINSKLLAFSSVLIEVGAANSFIFMIIGIASFVGITILLSLILILDGLANIAEN